MLEFNSKGLLVPNTNILSSIEELKEVFVEGISSKTRLDIFNKYLAYSDELKRLLEVKELKQWVNGSFVTKVANPKDIDLVTFVDYNLIQANEQKIEAFNNYSKKDVMLDVYIVPVYPKKHPHEFYYISDVAEWMSKFDKTRRDRKGVKNNKGFLEIIY